MTDDGRTFYDESWTSGSLSPADTVAVFDGHRPTPAGVERGPLIGRAGDLEDRADGLYATLTLADTAAGRDAYALARTMGAVHVSIEADVQAGAGDGGAVVRSGDRSRRPDRRRDLLAADSRRVRRRRRRRPRPTTPVEPDVPPADPDDPDAPITPDEVISRAEVADLVRTAVARFGLGRAVGRDRVAARAVSDRSTNCTPPSGPPAATRPRPCPVSSPTPTRRTAPPLAPG